VLPRPQFDAATSGCAPGPYDEDWDTEFADVQSRIVERDRRGGPTVEVRLTDGCESPVERTSPKGEHAGWCRRYPRMTYSQRIIFHRLGRSTSMAIPAEITVCQRPWRR